MPLASQPNVEALLLRALTASELTYLTALAALADAAIASECPGLTLDADTETATVTVGLDGELWTPRYPVTSVTSVTADGLVDTDVTFDAFGSIRPRGLVSWAHKIGGTSWPHGLEAEVTYAYGYAADAMPADLELIAAELVVAALTGPQGGIRQEQLGDHMVGYGAGAAGGRVRLDPDQRRKVRRYRRQITSLALDRAGP